MEIRNQALLEGLDQDQHDAVMACLEDVRSGGACNMFDSRCVAQMAEIVCDDGDAMLFVTEKADKRRGFGALLTAFSAWRQAQEAGAR